MSLFDACKVEINVYYEIRDTDFGKKILVLPDEEGKEKLKYDNNAVEILKTEWKLISWRESNDINKEAFSAVNSKTGEKEFDFLKFRDQMVKKCLKAWNIKEDGQKVPVTPENIDKLPANIVSNLYEKYNKYISYNDQERKN